MITQRKVAWVVLVFVSLVIAAMTLWFELNPLSEWKGNAAFSGLIFTAAFVQLCQLILSLRASAKSLDFRPWIESERDSFLREFEAIQKLSLTFRKEGVSGLDLLNLHEGSLASELRKVLVVGAEPHYFTEVLRSLYKNFLAVRLFHSKHLPDPFGLDLKGVLLLLYAILVAYLTVLFAVPSEQFFLVIAQVSVSWIGFYYRSTEILREEEEKGKALQSLAQELDLLFELILSGIVSQVQVDSAYRSFERVYEDRPEDRSRLAND